MKKLISVITLIVMTSVNVMYPFTYADSLGDNFEEIQNFDETMQDDGDFSDEENTEDEENEDDEGDLQEEQNDEEDENTDEEENENSDEEYEDDEEENTDEIADDVQGQDEQDIEDDENNEEQTEENNENDENTAEEDEDDDSSAIDLLKDLVEGSGNILTGEMLDLTGDNLELTGEVIELTGEALELSIARETLNADPIIGTENTKGVTVNVESQAGTFPEGTELRIKPITVKKELNEIKDQIIDSQENVSEDSELVAFDISFIYTLSGGKEIEVQPKDGEGVKVTFDYQNNENLSKADNNDEQEVKVFHIDDKDVNGEKVEKGEEVIKDVTNKRESEEDGIAVADAETFSVYAVVTTTVNGVQVTYSLNGGFWTEDGITATEDRVITYSYNSTTKKYLPSATYKTPSKTGNVCEGKKCMFDGWYLDENLQTKWKGDVSNNITVYAKWLPFDDLYVYFLVSESNKIHKLIMDRNIGATELYNGNFNSRNSNSFGYYFQWGNNYGIRTQSDATWINNTTVSNIIWSLGIPSKYYSSIYRQNDKTNWMNTTVNSEALWGGTGDTADSEGSLSSLEGRQGPCPDGYHVPSVVSWKSLFNSWNQIYNYAYDDGQNTPNIANFRDNFGVALFLPPAGRFGGNSWGGDGDYSYWSSSEFAGDRNTAYGFYAGFYGTQPDGINIKGTKKGDFKSRGRSIRCFKNQQNESPYLSLSNIHLNGGEKGIISIIDGKIVALKEPSRGNDAFRGWYTTSGYDEGTKIGVGSGLSQGDSLYAKWCADGLIDNGSQCINGYTITFDSNGGSSVSEQIVASGETGTRPTDPTKDEYQFSGWFIDNETFQNEFNFNTPITSNIILYAKWTPIEYTISYELNGGEVAISNPITYTIETQDFTLHNPTRVGYDFLGWSGTNLPGCSVEEHSTCSGTVSIQQGSTGNRVYEAIWDAEKYNLNFDSLGGSEVPTQRIVYGETGTRPEDPTKDGYEFSGWYYTGLETEFDFDTPITSNITIYAKWTLNTYTISYELNGGEVATSNPTTYTKESSEIILNNPSRDWYIFEGWSGTDLPVCSMEDTSNCIKTVTIPQGSTGDRTYEAIWGYVKHDLKFDSLGGSEVPTQRVIHGETGTKPADPTKDGYSFEGWYWTGLETPFNFTGTAITSDITVYAKWNLVNYNITYNLDGGTGLVNTGIYTVETQNFTLNNPTKLNYDFIGWSGTNLSGCSVDDKTTCNKNVSITQGSTGDRVYDAIFDCAYGRKLDGTCNIVRRTDGLIDYGTWEYNDLEVDLSITDPVKIVIMDRNLGAAVSGTGENAYGFLYQRGNNYGFSSIGELENVVSDQVDASTFGPGNYYVSDTFIVNGSGWDSSSNYNLWGGTGDVWGKRGAGDDEARQGPCPNGYHIPSVNEGRKFTDLIISWKSSGVSTSLCSNFSSKEACVMEKLRLVKAGNYDWQNGLGLVGQVGRYWTSSRFDQGNSYRIALTAAGGIYIGQYMDAQYYSISNGMSVRCFKNVSSKPIVYELSGGVQTSNQTSTVVWWNESAGKTLSIPTKTGFIFDGWYLTSGYEEGTRVTKNVISDYSDNESVTLYAKWKDPQYKTITYNANGGYFSGGLVSTGIVYKEETTSGNYITLSNVQFPNREGYMFDGWYLTGGETEWIGYVDNSTEEQTVYAKWLGFNDLTLTMSGITFTIMDRNLGATDYATGYTYGITNEQNSQSRRGKYYQWGNNYGFLSSGNPSSNVIINNTDDFGPGNYFSNATFIWNGGSQNGIWGNTNNNLWGGQYISSGDETRQGPCPVNYHVPTKNEWDKAINLFNTWKNTEEGNAYCNSLVNSGDKYCFSARLGLPFPGYRIGQNGFKFEDNTIPTYRSSSPTGESNKSYRIRIDNMNTESLRNGYGVVVRCFKNTEKRALNFETKGGSEIASTQTVRWWETTSSLPTPTRSNSTFTGWYTTPGYVEGSKVAINYIESDKNEITLYAKWECEDGYEEAADGRSCIKIGYTVTYDSITNGGTKEQQTERVEYGDHPILSSYTGYKAGWIFVGWNTNSGATAGLTSNQITVTSDITLYAIYKKEAKTLVITSYSLNGGGVTYVGGHNNYSMECTLPEVFNNNEQDTSCNVSMPFVAINNGTRREFVGINYNSGSTENADNVVREAYDYEISGYKTPVYSGTITLTEETNGLKWYIISKYPSLTLTGNFHGNGSTISGETSIGCTIDEIYNNASEVTTCALTPPTVTPSTNTPTFLGWNLSSGATANDTTYYNKGTNKLTLSLANGAEQDWYAITTAPEVKPKLYIHLNGNDGLAGPAFGSYSHNDVNNLDDVKIIFNLCTILSSYNGNQQSSYCTQNGTMFTFTPHGTKTALGYSATASTGSEILYTPGQTNITLTGYRANPEIHLYAQSILTGGSYGVAFSGNGATLGTNEDDELSLTCKGENSYNGEDETKSTQCNITTPVINRDGYTVQGYTLNQNYETIDTNLLTGGSKLTLSATNSGNVYYVSSYKPVSITFNRNGNTAQIKHGTTEQTTDNVVEVCNIWNRKQNCSITTPEIIPANGKVVKGYSTSSGSFENEISHQTPISVSQSKTYYAWSESVPVTYTANFVIGVGVNPIAVTSGSCTTEVKYNSEEVVTSCKVQLPQITAQAGYTDPKWYIGDEEVILDNERKTTINGNVEFVARATVNNHTVTITSNNDNFGRVTSGSVIAQNGVSITTSGNELTIGDIKVTAIATGNTQQYSYKFSGWNNNCGNALTGNCTIVAQFNRTVNEYTITFYTNGGLPVPPTQTKQYGLTGTKPADPTKIGYTFSGWFTDNETFNNKFDFDTPITDNISLYAKWTPITYSITYELNGGYLSGGATNPETYTIKTATFTLNNPTKIGYDFLGWSGTDLPECSVEEHSTCSETVSIQQGSTGNRKYTATWQARDDIIVTINYNFQDLNPYTNKLEKTYTLSGTETSLETADATITLSDYALNFDGYIYDYGEVNGEKTETTTVLPNGNRVIDLYYTRNKYDFDLVTDPNSTTAGTSSTGQYYYGAKITLSGDVNSDCFMWSGWNVDGVVLENNTNQTSFYMPANNVTVESSVTEKTYNIIFDGNDETSGEMEAINGIRCTESRQLPLNTFKKTGYTFSGWTTEPNGEKEYNDRATIQTLTTGNDITLEFIAVWDINKYEVVWKNYNGDVLDTQELPYLDIPEYKGGTAPSRPADAQYTYTFAGWTPEYTGVTGPQVYTAVYTTTLNEYTITWDIDGTQSTETYKYGETPSYKGFPHRDPTPQYEYTFAGWSPSITGVKEDATYTAQFNETLRTYTIRWENHNGDELEKDENVPYGTMPSYDGATPTRTGDAQHSYIFAGWSPETGMVVKDQTYTAIYHSNQNTYTIIWKNEDGTVLETDEDVPYGATPEYNGSTPTKESDAQYDYIFAGWTPATGMVVGDKTYIATYTPTLRKYTVTWKNSDGSVIKTDTGVEYGSTPEYKGSTPTSGGNDEFEYTFIGWNPTVGEIHGDTTYTALYEHNKRKYTVIWENGDGTVLRSGDVEYGETPTHGDISPTKTGDAQYSYRFIGWDPEISAVTGNITYVPKFESILNRYSITFVNDNGSTLKESIEYDYGTPRDEIAKPENTPTKASDAQYHYTFAGWSPATGMVVKDQIYTATYTTTLRDYTVTWKNEDGTVLKTDLNVPYGTTPTYNGTTPTKPSTAQYSYAFIGWDPALSEVKGDVTYTAKFSNVTEVYTITWEDEDGTELEKDENVPYGATPEYNGATPTKASDAQYDYTFAGWAPETGAVVGDQVYSATYTRVVRKYTVTWKNEDGTVLERDLNVPYGATPEYNGATPTKTGNAQYSYTFDRWTPTVDTVEGDMTYTATYNEIINKYTVTWENRDGTPLKIDEDVPYGTTQVYDGDTPTKEGDAQYSYTFNGWDKDVLEILEDTTYTATYTQTVNKYTIRFVDEDGTQLQSSELEYGIMPAYNGATPTKAATAQYTYTFDKWTPTLTGVTGPQVYTATYTQTVNKYTIKFVNEDGTELQSTEVEYGTTPAYNGSTPVKTGNAQYTYTFDKWTPTLTGVTGPQVYTATYTQTVNKYTIKFVNEDGTELQSSEVAYGVMPAYTGEMPTKAATAKYTYTFDRWTPTLTGVTGPQVYTATYTQTINKYTITWKDGDGNTLKTEQIHYGQTPEYSGVTPTKAATAQYTYTFNNTWSPAIQSVTENATYTAQFDSTVNKYLITFVDGDGKTIQTGMVEYGDTPSYVGTTPTKTATAQYTYTFNNTWNPTITGVTENATYKAQFDSTVNKYTVTWKNDDGTELEKDENVPYGTMPSYDGSTPIKSGEGSGNYEFIGWNPTPSAIVGNTEYTAKYKDKRVPEDNGGQRRSGGGGRKHTTSQSEETDQHGSAEDSDKQSESEKEVFDAYKRAYKYGITTMDTEKRADPDGYVTRGHLAKMVVNFTVNVLGKEMPVDTPTQCKRKDDDSEWKSKEIKFYAEKSCALGLMGLYTKEFKPNKIVDRAEFGTVVSRLLWGNTYDELDTNHNLYFTKHLKALQESGFMKDIDNPLGRKEYRKRVWIVLKRIELEKDKLKKES